jgi:drug/metabolite transporter (DMT)-like permease
MIEKHYNSNVSSMRGYAALAAGVIAISWSAIFIRWAPMPGSASAFYRLLFAAILLCPYVAVTHRRTLRFNRRSLWLAAVGGVFFAADLSLYSTSVLNSSAANATVLANNTPIAVGFLSWILMGNRPKAAFWAGLGIALSGSVLIVGADMIRHANFGAADLLALAASGCFGVYLLVTEKLREDFDTVTLVAVSLVASTVALLFFNLAAGVSLRITGAGAWFALLGLALVCQLLGYFSLTYALGHVSAGVTSVTLLVQCPLAALLAYLILSEPLTAAQAAGGVLVLAGVWIVNRYSRHQTILAE